MKFKAQNKQNQLIESITVHHLVIGVEALGIARKHECSVNVAGHIYVIFFIS
ncbi:hypothetical protein PASE110613_17605 [Paenibacillus sediminis]|uniref:Uncharacterized protein n=1 Tax=Paenibacillus sediminis TaxID=664909 RepID=A0ABS4H5A5_9BACL|nr:hypothetical protein [Paenibacillus sediminis]MBP1937270.1 hypothetical protein [Paenibacillus sediminis]